jgi:Domain of unknown function (DUF4390)
MTDFSTPCCKKTRPSWLACLLAVWLSLAAVVVHAQVATDISQLRLERAEDEWQLSAQMQFEIPTVVEEALLKGIPMVFVYSAEVLRERWYWYDKKVQATERNLRLAYQPLTRRWRLTVGSGAAASSGVGLVLNQSFDSLAQALSAIKRIARWKVADGAELDAGIRYKLDFRFRLDLAQLPRPFQIGALGQSEWDISASTSTPLLAENAK